MPSYVIVGGSRGVGLELVRQLAVDAENAVFVVARNEAGSKYLNELVEKSTTGNIHIVQADVVEASSMKAAAASVAKATGGSLDVLIHNAARTELTHAFRGLTDYEDDDTLDTEFIQSFKVNVLGAIHAVNAFLPLLRKGSAKKIAIIGSEGGTSEYAWGIRIPGMAAYATTKAAEHLVATKYAVLLEPEGFTVVTISPGLVDTRATAVEKADPADTTEMAGQIARFQEAFTNFKAFTPEEAVSRILSIVAEISPKDNASFWSYYEWRKKD
ncbi:hypothetical protein EVJ58_g3909 [Rhodofomes roseus]|nr:hypothetical protein EVJ58_g3909 [Rhodofomes roseus]